MISRLIVLILLTVLCGQLAVAQEVDHLGRGGRYKKYVEQNGYYPGDSYGNIGEYNTDNKPLAGKIFFGLTNSPMEYILSSTTRDRVQYSGIRLFKGGGSNDRWMLEVVPFVDYEAFEEIAATVRRQTETIDIPYKYLDQLPQESRDEIKEHNKQAPVAAMMDETYEPHPETQIFPLNHMGDNLYGKMVALIGNFKGQGIPAVVIGSDHATFRCVVEDEVWTLTIQKPQRRALQMSNLCRQIIEDVTRGDEFDEWKYVRMLEPIEF